MRRIIALLLSAWITTAIGDGAALPIIDMHMHAWPADAQGPPPVAMCTPWPAFPPWDQRQDYAAAFQEILKQPPCKNPVWSPATDGGVMEQTIEIMQRRNIVGVLSGRPERVATWMKVAPDRFYPGLELLLEDGELAPQALRALHTDGKLAVLAEVLNQYAGIAPGDERMAPYWALAEELDIPVGIHIGTGPPGAIYLGFSNYRAHLHSALTLEEVLVKHPRLRVYIMHAGFPMLDDLLAVLYAHPQVYVGVGVIVFMQPRAVFYQYLQGIVDAGYGQRVMFGSDQMIWPGVIERAIDTIEAAPFLDGVQKRDIFYNNAARFLRLSQSEMERHLGQ